MTAARDALNAVLTAEHANQRLLAYGQLLEALDGDLLVAVWDGPCNRATPLNTFVHHLMHDAARRDLHTPENCRWAQTSDMPYERYRTLGVEAEATNNPKGNP